MNWFTGVLLQSWYAQGVPETHMAEFSFLIGAFVGMFVGVGSLLAPSTSLRDTLKPQILLLMVIIPLVGILVGLMAVVVLFVTFVILNLMLQYLNNGFGRTRRL